MKDDTITFFPPDDRGVFGDTIFLTVKPQMSSPEVRPLSLEELVSGIRLAAKINAVSEEELTKRLPRFYELDGLRLVMGQESYRLALSLLLAYLLHMKPDTERNDVRWYRSGDCYVIETAYCSNVYTDEKEEKDYTIFHPGVNAQLDPAKALTIAVRSEIESLLGET